MNFFLKLFFILGLFLFLSFSAKSANAEKQNVWEWDSGTIEARQKEGLSDAATFSIGELHTLMLKKDGTVWAWGSNNYGQLGNGSFGTTAITDPIQVKSPDGQGFLNDIKAIGAGKWYSMALKNDGTVLAWGFNGNGMRGTRTGMNDSNNKLLLPTFVKNETGSAPLSEIESIATGENHTLALKTDGKVLAWGQNNYGQIGIGCSLYNCSEITQPMVALREATSVGSGNLHSIASKADGTVWAWGRTVEGQLGSFVNGTSYQASPIKIIGISQIKKVYAKDYYSVALSDTHKVYEWGGGRYIPAFADPRQIPDLEDVTEIAGGTSYYINVSIGLSIKKDGTVWQWNRKDIQPKRVSNLSNISAVAVGKFTTNFAAEKLDSNPVPFLDLPWDYKSKGSTFNEAALAINSYFDHEYPFLSSGIREPIDSSNSVRKYNGSSRSNDYYSSHDGYDYGSPAKIEDGDWVLAAAPGEATLVKEENSRGGGNVVKITHPNGFQTWYEHLSSNDLIVATEDTKVDVEQGQKIGRVGHSGNCYVENNGTKFYNTLACAHLHFSVFQDKNEDEDFRDNLPDGVTDPFGWQSTDPDPWENYTFNYGGKEKKGNKSYYLWNTNLAGMKTIIATSGGNFKNERFTFNFGPNTISKSLNIEIISEPIVKVSKILQSIGSTIKATAKDSLGNLVTQFDNPYTLSVDFENFDLSNIDLESIAIYSSSEGVVWLKEPTIMDIVNKKVTSQINHFSYFAVMGEKKDLTPPETKVIVDGGGEKNGWYNSEINLSLDANDEGIGVDKIYYKIEGEDWNTYQTPINFSEEGNHKIEFYAEDKGENVEDVKKVEFKIDKTPPVLSSQTSIEGSPYTFNSWTNKDVTTTFSCTDSLSGIDNFSSPITVSSEGENQSVEGECKDNAGNVSRLKISGINIDKTPPDLTLTAPLSIWPPNGKMVNIEIGGAINEPHLLSKKFTIIDEYNKIEPEMTDFSTIQLEAKRNGDDPDGRQYLISLEATDLAGNKNRAEIKVIVPHDKSSK